MTELNFVSCLFQASVVSIPFWLVLLQHISFPMFKWSNLAWTSYLLAPVTNAGIGFELIDRQFLMGDMGEVHSEDSEATFRQRSNLNDINYYHYQ